MRARHRPAQKRANHYSVPDRAVSILAFVGIRTGSNVCTQKGLQV